MALANFRWLWRIMEKVVFDQQWWHGLQALMKFGALVGAIFLILIFLKVNPAAFAAGVSLLIPGILFEVIRGSSRDGKN